MEGTRLPRRSRSLKKALALLLALVLLFPLAPGNVSAHLDPPGLPAINVSAKIGTLRLTSSQNDGLDANSELLLTLHVTHWLDMSGLSPYAASPFPKHGENTVSYEKDDYNYYQETYHRRPDGSIIVARKYAPDWVIDDVLWQHSECSPRDALTGVSRLIEVDVDWYTTGAGIAASSLGGMLADIAAKAMVVGSGAGVAGMVAGALVGAGVSIIVAIDGNDDLGTHPILFPPNGGFTLNSQGKDGGAKIYFESKTSVIQDNRCNPQTGTGSGSGTGATGPGDGTGSGTGAGTGAGTSTGTETSFIPSDRAAAIYGALKESLAMADKFAPEPGNPAGLTEARMDEIKASWRQFTLGIGETAAAAAILDASHAPGVEAAMEFYLMGREAAAENPALALGFYQNAYARALTAFIEAGEAAGGAKSRLEAMPLTIAMTTDRISTLPSRKFQVLAAALGASGPAKLQAGDLPSGVEMDVQTLEGAPAHVISFTIGEDAAPGTYPIRLTFTDGEEETERTFTLVVNPVTKTAPSYPAIPEQAQITETSGGKRASVEIGTISEFEALREVLEPDLPDGDAGEQAVLDFSDWADELDLRMAGPLLLDLMDRNVSLHVMTGRGSITFNEPDELIPPVWLERFRESAGDLQILLQIRTASEGEARLVRQSAQSASAEILTEPAGVTYSLSVDLGGGMTIPVTSFGDAFVPQVITLPYGPDPAAATAAVLTDAGLRPVPTIFAGNHAIVLHNRPGTYTVITRDAEFADMKDHWAASAVRTLHSKLIVSGTGAGRFDPNRSVTRAEATAMIARGLGLLPETAGQSFRDVPQDAWYRGEVGAASGFGLVSGYADGTFRPGGPITRAEAAVMLVRAAEKLAASPLPGNEADLAGFADRSAIPDWAAGYLAKAVRAGMMSGYPDNTLQPGRTITRAELASLLLRTLEKAEWLDTGKPND